jgi:hypothetical protein
MRIITRTGLEIVTKFAETNKTFKNIKTIKNYYKKIKIKIKIFLYHIINV